MIHRMISVNQIKGFRKRNNSRKMFRFSTTAIVVVIVVITVKYVLSISKSIELHQYNQW